MGNNEMKKDTKMLHVAFQQIGLKLTSEDIKDEKTKALAALNVSCLHQSYHVFRILSEELQDNEQIVMVALKGCKGDGFWRSCIFDLLSEKMQQNESVRK